MSFKTKKMHIRLAMKTTFRIIPLRKIPRMIPTRIAPPIPPEATSCTIWSKYGFNHEPASAKKLCRICITEEIDWFKLFCPINFIPLSFIL